MARCLRRRVSMPRKRTVLISGATLLVGISIGDTTDVSLCR